MFRNYLKVAFRNIRKYKGYSFINIAGLTFGMACCLLMLLYVAFELSYDRYHSDAGRIFRIVTETDADIPAIPPLENELLEVKRSCRLFTYSWREKALLAFDDKFFYEDRFFLAEPSINEIFNIRYVKGDPQTVLEGGNSIVLSESAARRFFEKEDPVGKVIAVKNLGQLDYIVTGVFKDMPANSHLHCDFIAPLRSGEDLFWEGFLKRNSGYTYVLLNEGVSAAGLQVKLPGFFQKHLGENARYYTPSLQALTDIHLHSHLRAEIESNSDIRFIYLFSALALLILLAACFNAINLATARSANRALEVGLRKVVGAHKRNLIRQFMGEAMIISFLTLPLAFLLVEALLPAFNSLVKRSLSLNLSGNLSLILGSLGIAFFVGIFSGFYPAFVLSSFQPIAVLKGRLQTGARKSGLRSILVVTQYTISVVLIISTLVVSGQMRYINKKDLGFQKEHIVIIPMKDWETIQNYDLVKNVFIQSPYILAVTGSRSLPSNTGASHPVWFEGLDTDKEQEFFWNAVDYNFLETFGMELVAGRSFSPEYATDDKDAYLINESAAKILGWDSPLGKNINLSNKELKNKVFGKGTVIGVVRDFHFQSLRQKIEPIVLNIYREQFRLIAVKIDGENTKEALRFMETRWKSINPERPIEFSFFDDRVEFMYREDQRTGKILSYSTLMSMLIACLGLFGLAAFSIAQRRKEICVRRILGASIRGILLLLSKDITWLVLVSNVFACPIALFIARNWIRNFAYRIPLSAWFFLSAAAFSFLIALLTIGYQSLRAALANPVDSLRYE